MISRFLAALTVVVFTLLTNWLRADVPADFISLKKWEAAPPFHFEYGGKDSGSILATWPRTEETEPSPGGQLHRYIYRDPATKLKFVAEVRTFTDYPAIDWVLRFTNEGTADTPIIEQIQPLAWTITPGVDNCVLHHARGSNMEPNDFEPIDDALAPGAALLIGSVNGRSSDTNTLPFFNLQMGDRGIFGAIGWTGNWNAAFDFNKDIHKINVHAGMRATHFVLHPGESVRSPRILLMNWSGNDWHAAQNTWRRLALAYYSPLEPDGRAIRVPYCLGAWGAEKIDAKLAIVRSLHEAQVPFDVYWIDAGWYGDEVPKGNEPDMNVQWFRYRGTWTPNATTYPNGFRPLGDALKADGYGFLLWFEAETADPGSALRTEHPDWFFQVPNPANPGTALLNLGNPDARKGITTIVSDLTTKAGLTWYRQDFNIPADGYWAQADTPDRVGIAEIKHITGLYQFWDDLRAAHPGLQIDNCSSGGRRLDLETMSRSVSLWRTDYECGFFDPVYGQLETQGLAPWVPLNAGNYGGVAPGTPNDGASLVYAMRSNYSAGLVLNPGDRGAPGDLSLEVMKKVGDDFHAVQPYFTGDFYAPLGYTAALDSWNAWQFHRADLKTGAVLVFRRQKTTAATMKVPLAEIDPAATYEVEIRPGFEKVPATTMSGHDLENLEVTIPDKPGSVIVFYKQR